MPTGNEPPPVKMSQGVVNALAGMTYSSADKAFRNSSNVLYYLFVETDGSNGAQWFYGTNAEGGVNPRGMIPADTAEIIAEGTFNTQTLAIGFSGSNYKVRLERDANGVPIARSYTV